MIHTKVQLARKQADGYAINLGKVNLVNVVTDVGMVGCGAFDVDALNNFDYPAARVKPTRSSEARSKGRNVGQRGPRSTQCLHPSQLRVPNLVVKHQFSIFGFINELDSLFKSKPRRLSNRWAEIKAGEQSEK